MVAPYFMNRILYSLRIFFSVGIDLDRLPRLLTFALGCYGCGFVFGDCVCAKCLDQFARRGVGIYWVGLWGVDVSLVFCILP